MSITTPGGRYGDVFAFDDYPMDLENAPKKVSPLEEIGVTGRQAGLRLHRRGVPPGAARTQGRPGLPRDVAQRLRSIGALLFTIEKLIREVEWKVVGDDASPEQSDAVQFVESAWRTCPTAGTTSSPRSSRCSPTAGPGTRSSTRGGSAPGRRIPRSAVQVHRRADRLAEDADPGPGDAAALVLRRDRRGQGDGADPAPVLHDQRHPDREVAAVPHRVAKGNPEGRRILRDAYRAWYFKKRLEEFEAIGVERDLAGMPVGKVPATT